MRFYQYLWLLLLTVGWLGLVGACSSQPPRTVEPAATSTATAPILTPIPGIAATVTAVHRLPTLSPVEAAPYREISEMVVACPAFHPKRSRAVLQHLTWLTSPNEVPPEFIALFGSNVSAQLASGAAYTVAVEWKLAGRPADSCLIPIGHKLNEVAISLNGKPSPEFVNP